MATVTLGSATPGSYGAVTEIYGEDLRMPGMLRKSAAFAPRNRKFKSISLQQKVTCELDFRARRLVHSVSSPAPAEVSLARASAVEPPVIFCSGC